MEHAYCPKDSFLAERGKPHSLYIFPVPFTHSVLLSSGQVLIQEEGKEDILWECKSVSSYLTSWEFLQQLVAAFFKIDHALFLLSPKLTGAGQGIKKARRPSSGTKAAGATMIKIALCDLPYRSSFSITRR